jgi:outer membrane lipoprotein-sorting protein
MAILLFSASALHAQSALSASEIYQKLLQAQEQQAFLSCDIVREEIQAQGAAQRVTGTLEVASGGRAMLLMTVPSRQLALSDGHTLWVEMSDVKQVMKYNADQLKQSGNFFLDLTSSIRHYAKLSLKRLIVPGPGFDDTKVFALEIMPLDAASAGFQSMKVWVDKDAWLVRQVELKLGGVDTRVQFENIHVVTKEQEENGAQTADPKLFKYQVPKGYEVYDLGAMQQ